MKSQDIRNLLILADKLSVLAEMLTNVSRGLNSFCENSYLTELFQPKPASEQPVVRNQAIPVKPKQVPRYLTLSEKEQIRADFNSLSDEYKLSRKGIRLLANRFKCTPKQIAGVVRRFKRGITKR